MQNFCIFLFFVSVIKLRRVGTSRKNVIRCGHQMSSPGLKIPRKDFHITYIFGMITNGSIIFNFAVSIILVSFHFSKKNAIIFLNVINILLIVSYIELLKEYFSQNCSPYYIY